MRRWKRHHLEMRESVLTLLCGEAWIGSAKRALRRNRCVLEAYIAAHPRFAESFAPIAVEPGPKAIAPEPVWLIWIAPFVRLPGVRRTHPSGFFSSRLASSSSTTDTSAMPKC